MASRDLTRKFEALRNSLIGQVTVRPLNATTTPGSTIVEIEPLNTDGTSTSSSPPDWVDIVANVKADIKIVHDNLLVLDKLHKKRLQVSFDDAVREQEQEIEILTQQITNLLKKNEQRVKMIAGPRSGLELTSQERVTRVNVMRVLATELQDHSKQFRSMQKQFLTALKKQGNLFLPNDAGGAGDGGMGAGAGGDDFSDSARAQMEANLQSGETRYKAILTIAKNVNELAALFKELNVLVIEQGSILDRIDYNLEQTVIKVQSGTKHLTEADKTSRKAFTFKCIVLLAIVVVILILVLIIKKSS